MKNLIAKNANLTNALVTTRGREQNKKLEIMHGSFLAKIAMPKWQVTLMMLTH